MSYKKALEILEALPAEKRNLISGVYLDANGGRCAIGTLMPELGDALVAYDKRRGIHPFSLHFGRANCKRFSQLKNYYDADAENLTKLINDGLERLEMTAGEAADLQSYNDGLPVSDVTDAERYAKVVEWVGARAWIFDNA